MVLGESPIYRASDSTLHWVDCLITPPELHILHLDPTTHQPLGPSKRIPLSDSVSVLFFRQSHPKSYICAYYQGIAFLDEDTGKLEVVKEIIPAQERGLRRFNDGGVDAKGRLWLAEIDVRAAAAVDAVASDEGKERVLEELGEPVGRLWRYDPDGTLHLMDRGVICGNGVGWSPDWKSSECFFLLLYFHFYCISFSRKAFLFFGERERQKGEKNPLTPITLPPIKIIQLTLVKKPREKQQCTSTTPSEKKSSPTISISNPAPSLTNVS